MCDNVKPRAPVCLQRRRCDLTDNDESSCDYRDKTIFSIERPKNRCVIKFDAETVIPTGASGAGDVVKSGPMCVDCGDVVNVVGLNGITVQSEVIGGERVMTIDTDELDIMLSDSLCFCSIGPQRIPLPYGLDLPTFTNDLQVWLDGDLTNAFCSSETVCASFSHSDDDGSYYNLSEELKEAIFDFVEKHATSAAYLDPTGFGDWVSNVPNFYASEIDPIYYLSAATGSFATFLDDYEVFCPNP